MPAAWFAEPTGSPASRSVSDMNRLSIVADTIERARAINLKLSGLFQIQAFPRQGLPRTEPSPYTIVDINLIEEAHLSDLREWLMRRPAGGKAVFAVDHGVARQTVQAFAIGATDVMEHPLNRKALLKTLLGDLDSMAAIPLAPELGKSAAITAAAGALRSIFGSIFSGAPIDMKSVEAAGEVLVSNIEAQGLTQWIEAVRSHHSQTYQHCLVVTGIAVEFGRRLGFSIADKHRLALAGLLHDLGKAGVPVAILEKPGPLDKDERAVMRQHPQLGYESLRGMAGLDPRILDIVLSHHEFLDGSGYPRGLAGSELSDLVRMVTIADIYGAMIEKRSYMEPRTSQAAYQALEDMGGKLDPDLLREFRACTRTLA
jgi:putative nucleotidyltransferase with HDIG domain